ncbi:SDR family NAD(P)-dependent oxidoreductase [Niveispirillum irakense]|uniref:SDR family NAD(P)-dependent oxidoreductase n=1 Tax=Niveispirillum irakense TaxID=34011 RepID=UPI00040C0D98|nr:SDR family oxidoreductase [Niveispirillum irakense]
MSHAIYPSLKDKRVLITGGGSGIGAGFVEAFVRQGAKVHLIDIADADAAELLATLKGTTGTLPTYHHCDLTDLNALRATIDKIIELEGGVDILVNNAANDDRHVVEDVTPEYWDNRMAVNLRHLYFAAQAVIPSMKANGGGAIINLGSISWHLALPDIALYQTAKAGIEGMTRAMARDLGADNIRVTCIVPGGVKTPRQMRLWHNPEEEARMLGQQCLKYRVEPKDIAAMALFLASDDARLCTGHNYFVDAGWR